MFIFDFSCLHLEFLHFLIVQVDLEVFTFMRLTKNLPQTKFHCKRRAVLTIIIFFPRAEDIQQHFDLFSPRLRLPHQLLKC